MAPPDGRIVAPCEGCVLVQGADEEAAQIAAAIHNHSRRAKGPWIEVDCRHGSPKSLSLRLFGARRGSAGDAAGALAVAKGGTVLLRNIERLHPKLQEALMHYLSSGRFLPLAAQRSQMSDAWIFACCESDLVDEVRRGAFSAALYATLSIVFINVSAPDAASERATMPCSMAAGPCSMAAGPCSMAAGPRSLPAGPRRSPASA